MGGRRFSVAASDTSPRLPHYATRKQYLFKKVKTDTRPYPGSLKAALTPKHLGGDGGLEPPLTEAMASLTWLSRWSFLRRAPVSGQMKYTPGTARCVEPSSLGSGTWEDVDKGF